MVFQSTPPARGATWGPFSDPLYSYYFNPRPPRGGRPKLMPLDLSSSFISIHAPREGGDRQEGRETANDFHFNPRPPRGGRRGQWRQAPGVYRISIHAPREGGDLWRWHGPCAGRQFQSTPPARGATPAVCANSTWTPHFNPRPPRGGRPASPENLYNIAPISIHAPREGGDSKDAQFYLWIFDK